LIIEDAFSHNNIKFFSFSKNAWQRRGLLSQLGSHFRDLFAKDSELGFAQLIASQSVIRQLLDEMLRPEERLPLCFASPPHGCLIHGIVQQQVRCQLIASNVGQVITIDGYHTRPSRRNPRPASAPRLLLYGNSFNYLLFLAFIAIAIWLLFILFQDLIDVLLQFLDWHVHFLSFYY
jgi:hypothetical protein